jgi:hypothetical protein
MGGCTIISFLHTTATAFSHGLADTHRFSYQYEQSQLSLRVAVWLHGFVLADYSKNALHSMAYLYSLGLLSLAHIFSLPYQYQKESVRVYQDFHF